MPTFDVEAAEALADAMVPSFSEELTAVEADASTDDRSRKRLAQPGYEEPASKVGLLLAFAQFCNVTSATRANCLLFSHEWSISFPTAFEGFRVQFVGSMRTAREG